MDCRLGQLLS
uniref:Uncharacterized protein n=1 Tax=Arundo donax TaxID=35708 RepID=A0A0A9EFB5_ARUDO